MVKRIGFIDDHEFVAIAVGTLVADIPDVEVGPWAPDVDSFLHHTSHCDLVVLDLRLDDGSAPSENVRRLADSGAIVLVLTSGESPDLVRDVARADVAGVLRKSAPPAVIRDSIARALRGETVPSPEWAGAIESDPDLDAAKLSAQEAKVLRIFADGAKAEVVSSALGIARSTVDDYVRRIRTKYAAIGRPADSKIDLYKRAVEDGHLPVPTARTPSAPTQSA